MGKTLSPDEIQALLTSVSQIQHGTRVLHQVSAAPVTTYDFRRPDKITKDQIRSLRFLHDRFARNVATSLSAYLRVPTDVSVVSVEQFTYAEFLMTLPELTAFYAITLQPFDTTAALELNPSVAFPMIDRMLGGPGEAAEANKILTEIEQNVVDGVIKLLMDNLTESWQAITKIEFRVGGRETRPQMLQVASPNDAVIVLAFEVKLLETRGMLNLAIPVPVVESIGSGFVSTGGRRQHRQATELDRRRLLQGIARIPLPVDASIPAELTVRDLLALQPGDTLSLGRSANDPVDVRVGDTIKFAGRLMRTERGAAVRIEHRAAADDAMGACA